jgi:hypothetical protein
MTPRHRVSKSEHAVACTGRTITEDRVSRRFRRKLDSARTHRRARILARSHRRGRISARTRRQGRTLARNIVVPARNILAPRNNCFDRRRPRRSRRPRPKRPARYPHRWDGGRDIEHR